MTMLYRLVADSLTVFQVESRYFRTAARFAHQHALGLRAGDSLHLPMYTDYGAKPCIFDQRLAAAAPALGVETRSI